MWGHTNLQGIAHPLSSNQYNNRTLVFPDSDLSSTGSCEWKWDRFTPGLLYGDLKYNKLTQEDHNFLMEKMERDDTVVILQNVMPEEIREQFTLQNLENQFSKSLSWEKIKWFKKQDKSSYEYNAEGTIGMHIGTFFESFHK